MNVEHENRLLRSAEIRAIRALRLALTILLEASEDIIDNLAGDPGFNEPAETEQERVKNWNIVRPLLLQAAKSIETVAKAGNLGAERIQEAIESCENTIKVLRQEAAYEHAAKLLETLLEKLRADPDSYQILFLKALLAGIPREVVEITFRSVEASRGRRRP